MVSFSVVRGSERGSSLHGHVIDLVSQTAHHGCFPESHKKYIWLNIKNLEKLPYKKCIYSLESV